MSQGLGVPETDEKLCSGASVTVDANEMRWIASAEEASRLPFAPALIARRHRAHSWEVCVDTMIRPDSPGLHGFESKPLGLVLLQTCHNILLS